MPASVFGRLMALPWKLDVQLIIKTKQLSLVQLAMNRLFLRNDKEPDRTMLTEKF